MRNGIVSLLLLVASFPARAADPVSAIVADPVAVRLNGPKAVYSLLIHGQTAAGTIDLTHAARYRSLDPKVATVNDAGVIRAAADGSTTVEVEAAGRKVSVAVTVKGAAEPRRFNFENDVVPLFSRFGCNSSGCHGKAEGQNGFKLSVFGFDPAADYAALVKEGRGRRVFPAAPEPACCWRRCPAGVPHGGGVRIRARLAEYETLRDWVAAGMPFGRRRRPEGDGRARRAARAPTGHARRPAAARHRPLLRRPRGRRDRARPLPVEQRRPGRGEADGLVSAGDVPGEAAIMAGYMNAVDVFRAVVPRPEPHRQARPTCRRTTSSTASSAQEAAQAQRPAVRAGRRRRVSCAASTST